jgi:hypothetical protein
MVQTLCKTSSPPQGVTHSVSAFWLAPKQDSEFPNLILIRTTVLEVYSLFHHGRKKAQVPSEGHQPSHTLQLEYTKTLHGEVQALACLASRRTGQRDSIVLAFDMVCCYLAFACQ